MRTQWAMHSGEPQGTSVQIESILPTENGFIIVGEAAPHGKVDPEPRIRVGNSAARVTHVEWKSGEARFAIEVDGPPVYGRQTLGVWLGDPWCVFDVFED